MLLVCAAGIFIMKNKQSTEYDQYITIAEKYFKDEDYENAIVSYKEAIKKNDKDEEAYIGIAKTYYKMNDIASAVKYLQSGYKKTNSSKIKNLLNDYNDLLNGKSNVTYSLNEVAKGSENVTIKQDVLAFLSTYTFSGYSGIYQMTSTSGEKEVEYEGIPAKFVYSASPEDSSKPQYIEVTSPEFIFDGYTTGITNEKLTEMGLFGLKQVPVETFGLPCVEFMCRGCNVIIQSDENGNIVMSKPWIVVMPDAGNDGSDNGNENDNQNGFDVSEDDTPEVGFCLLKGTAYNEAMSSAVSKVTLRFYYGNEAKQSMLCQEIKTGSNGKYRIELQPGEYYVEVIVEDEVVLGKEFELVNVDEITKIDLPYNYARELRKGEIRVVLSWEDKNANFDHILEGTDGDGNYVFCSHSPFDPGNHQHYVGDVLVIESGPEKDGGPEVVTVFDVEGYYEYTVTSSFGYIYGAKVEVYTSDSETPEVFECPDDLESDWWTVFVYENGKIKAMS